MASVIELRPSQIPLEILMLTCHLQWDTDTEKGIRRLQTILHALRDLSSLDDAIDILLLLPHSMRAVYLMDWDAAEQTDVYQESADFATVVRRKAGKLAFFDFPTTAETEAAIELIFNHIQFRLDAAQRRTLLRHVPAMVRPYLSADLVENIQSVSAHT